MKYWSLSIVLAVYLTSSAGADTYDFANFHETVPGSFDTATSIEDDEQVHYPVEDHQPEPEFDNGHGEYIDELDDIQDLESDQYNLEPEVPEDFLAPDTLKKVICYDSEQGDSPAPEPHEEGVEYVYIEQKRILALVPGPMGLNMTVQLRDEMKADPFFVQTQGYHAFGVVGVPYSRQREQLLSSVEQTLVKYVEKHGDCVTLDLLGHSLGGFVALAAGSRNQIRLSNGKFLSETVGKLVTLAGATWGQTPQDDVPADLAAWVPLMTDLRPHISVPNTFLQGFREVHAAAYADWSKCSLYSTGDQSVQSPHNAGCFDGSPCVNVPATPRGWVHFLWLIDGATEQDAADHQKFYSAMKSTCWSNAEAAIEINDS